METLVSLHSPEINANLYTDTESLTEGHTKNLSQLIHQVYQKDNRQNIIRQAVSQSQPNNSYFVDKLATRE